MEIQYLACEKNKTISLQYHYISSLQEWKNTYTYNNTNWLIELKEYSLSTLNKFI